MIKGSAESVVVLPRRRSLLPSILVLSAAAIALFCFIGGLADIRRTNNAMRQAAEHGSDFAARAQGAGVLPLNLEPRVPPALDPRLVRFDWVPTDEAMDLRGTEQAVLAAWSAPVFRLFAADGRAVVLFRNGAFEPVWLTLGEFALNQERQATALRHIRAARTVPSRDPTP